MTLHKSVVFKYCNSLFVDILWVSTNPETTLSWSLILARTSFSAEVMADSLLLASDLGDGGGSTRRLKFSATGDRVADLK